VVTALLVLLGVALIAFGRQGRKRRNGGASGRIPLGWVARLWRSGPARSARTSAGRAAQSAGRKGVQSVRDWSRSMDEIAARGVGAVVNRKSSSADGGGAPSGPPLPPPLPPRAPAGGGGRGGAGGSSADAAAAAAIDAVNALARVPWGDLRDVPLHLRVFAEIHEAIATAERRFLTRLEEEGALDPRVIAPAHSAPGQTAAAGESFGAASRLAVSFYRGVLDTLESQVRMPSAGLLGNSGQRLSSRAANTSGKG
jgi:hypothetical protein